MRLRSSSLALGALMLCCCRSGAPSRDADSPGADSPGACAQLPFFRTYEEHGASSRQGDHRIELDLPVDLHSADCGAPDSYGHEMTLTLVLTGDQGRCVIKDAFAVGRAYAPPELESPDVFWKNTFTVTGTPDLASADLRQIELRDPARRQALLLLRSRYWFYENVVEGGRLKPALESEDTSDCCYGFTRSKALRWSDPSP